MNRILKKVCVANILSVYDFHVLYGRTICFKFLCNLSVFMF